MRSRSPAWVAGRTQHKATGRLSGYGDAGHARAGRDMLVTRPWDIQVSDSKPGYSPRVPRGPRGHVVSGVSLGCRTSLATADTSRRSGSLAFADGSESRDFTRMPRDRPPEPWLSFLIEIDPAFDQPVALHCIGGFTIAILYGLPRPTVDVADAVIQALDFHKSHGVLMINVACKARILGTTKPSTASIAILRIPRPRQGSLYYRLPSGLKLTGTPCLALSG